MRALTLAIGMLLLTAPAVLAHASLVESDPPEGGAVEGTPATLTATFDEPLDAARSRLVVRDAAGTEVARGGVGTDPLRMSVALPTLPAGEYTARWTAVTPDDQGVTRGTIQFTVAEVAPPAPPAASQTVPPTSTSQPAPTARPVTTTGTAPVATATPPSASPVAAPTPSPQPPAGETGMTDLLIAFVLAGAIVAGLAVYLMRR